MAIEKTGHFSGTLASDKVAGWAADVILDGAAAIPHISVGPHWITPRDLINVADAIRFAEIKLASTTAPAETRYT